MDDKSFDDLVERMRDAQRYYFAAKDRVLKASWLKDSKRLEREVDAAILERKRRRVQPSLLDQ